MTWLRWLEVLVAALGVSIAAIWLYAYFAIGFRSVPYKGLIDARTAEVLLLQHGAHFAIGTLLYYAATERWTWLRAASVTVCLAGATHAIFTKWGTLANVGYWFWLGSVISIYVSAIYSDEIERFFGRAAPAIASVGLATYPFYLLHDLIGAAAMKYLLMAGVERFTALALAFAAMVALAMWVTAGPEAVLRRALRALAGAAFARIKMLEARPAPAQLPLQQDRHAHH